MAKYADLFKNMGSSKAVGDEMDIEYPPALEGNFEELIGSSRVPPVIRIVNAIISEAIRIARANGMKTLLEDGLEKMRRGGLHLTKYCVSLADGQDGAHLRSM